MSLRLPRPILRQTRAPRTCAPTYGCLGTDFTPAGVYKPRSAPCFRYFTTTGATAMSPALLNSTSDSDSERLPYAVAVYCGASSGTEAAFHHAAVCKNLNSPFFFAWSRILVTQWRKTYPIFFSFSSGARSRHAWSAACVWRRHARYHGHHLGRGPQTWRICYRSRPCCHASRRRRGRSDHWRSHRSVRRKP